MNKLLVITVLVALLSLNAESFRMPRQAVEDVEPPVKAEEAVEEEKGTLTKFTDGVKSYYNSAVNTATGYLDSIRGLKLEEKVKNIYTDTATAVNTYAGIVNDQLYHTFYSQQ
ncbi:LOW QUALITY PROTEIN: apolipoprotein C-II [Xyrichtys novacula]|uniref:Apolipoprotein C-II n=1 Tax=Xyrichtys novacula TaxID=13765 RepID=A0AAV1FN81_XYRNO|nr:LOW QUALITY PROTEIN: apolipoprotein C-II [Xyrichtys novacula]